MPELKAHREDIAAELRWRTHAPVAFARLSLRDPAMSRASSSRANDELRIPKGNYDPLALASG